MGEDSPAELLVTVTFEEVRGKTRMTLRHPGIPPGVMVDMTKAGWNGSFDELAEVLEEEKPGAPKTRLCRRTGKNRRHQSYAFSTHRMSDCSGLTPIRTRLPGGGGRNDIQSMSKRWT